MISIVHQYDASVVAVLHNCIIDVAFANVRPIEGVNGPINDRGAYVFLNKRVALSVRRPQKM